MKKTLVTLAAFALVVAAFLFGIRLGGDNHDHSPIETTAGEQQVYTCSMHPQVRSAEQGRCPICGMELIPAGGAEGEDRALVMTPTAMKLAEIRTEPVVRKFPVKTVRLVGEVDFDESRLAKISAYFPGRLERLFVDSTGVPVREGDHLAEIYSPDLVAAQEELRQSQRALDSQTEASATMRVLTEATLEAAREKLRLWGLTEEQIDTVAGSTEPLERMTIYSPMSGVVIQRHATQGQYVGVGEEIYTVADLGRLWVVLDVYESQLQWIHYGQRVEFTTDALPGELFEGRISFIEPVLSRETRTVQVRVNVDNRDGRLKPGMFVRTRVSVQVAEDGASVDDELSGMWICPMHPELVKSEQGICDICEMALAPAEEMGFSSVSRGRQAPLVIPASAPLITGTRAVVYVRDPGSEEPRFEGREVTLGPRAGDFFVVRQGLREGEEVVVKGAFKIDSAMQIEARGSMMSPSGGAPVHGHADEPSPRSAVQPIDLSGTALAAYLEAQVALAGDDLPGFVDAARGGLPDRSASSIAQLDELDIDAARSLFADWSTLLIEAAGRGKLPGVGDDMVVAFCPMALDNRGAEWIQRGTEIRNPYFGASMSRCGEVRRRLDSGGE